MAWGEWLNWRWSRSLVHDRQGGSVAIVVPGFRNPRPSANAINRWRTRAALRSAAGEYAATVIFTGGAVAGGHPEAELMAHYATTDLAFTGPILTETRSRTSWENVTNVLPLMENADRVVIASQPAHALKIRAYIRRQRPDVAERLVRGGDYRFGEWAPLKPILAVYGLWTLRGLTADERHTGTPGRSRGAHLLPCSGAPRPPTT